jgi:hypothetical protein
MFVWRMMERNQRWGLGSQIRDGRSSVLCGDNGVSDDHGHWYECRVMCDGLTAEVLAETGKRTRVCEGTRRGWC